MNGCLTTSQHRSAIGCQKKVNTWSGLHCDFYKTLNLVAIYISVCQNVVINSYVNCTLPILGKWQDLIKMALTSRRCRFLRWAYRPPLTSVTSSAPRVRDYHPVRHGTSLPGHWMPSVTPGAHLSTSVEETKVFNTPAHGLTSYYLWQELSPLLPVTVTFNSMWGFSRALNAICKAWCSSFNICRRKEGI